MFKTRRLWIALGAGLVLAAAPSLAGAQGLHSEAPLGQAGNVPSPSVPSVAVPPQGTGDQSQPQGPSDSPFPGTGLDPSGQGQGSPSDNPLGDTGLLPSGQDDQGGDQKGGDQKGGDQKGDDPSNAPEGPPTIAGFDPSSLNPQKGDHQPPAGDQGKGAPQQQGDTKQGNNENGNSQPGDSQQGNSQPANTQHGNSQQGDQQSPAEAQQSPNQGQQGDR